MRKLHARAASALLFITFASFVGACAKDDVAPVDVEKQAFEDLRNNIREVIDDTARETAAIKLVGELEESLSVLRSSVTERKAVGRKLNANYDTTRAEFDAFIARMEAEVRDNREQVSKKHLEFRATVTAEERLALSKTHTRAMNSAIKTIQAI